MAVSGKKRVLILCSGNAARSQMTERLLRHYAGDRFEVFSASTVPSVVRPEAIAVMNEIGLELSGQRSKPVEAFTGKPLDYVITVCDAAKEVWPVFPGNVQHLHWPFDDPSAVEGPTEIRQAAFRRIRDQIDARITAFLGTSAQAEERDTRSKPPGRHEMIGQLEEGVRRTEAEFTAASRAFNSLLDEIPSGLPPTDGAFRLQQAGRAFRIALSNHSRALRKLSEFIREGKVPPANDGEA